MAVQAEIGPSAMAVEPLLGKNSSAKQRGEQGNLG